MSDQGNTERKIACRAHGEHNPDCRDCVELAALSLKRVGQPATTRYKIRETPSGHWIVETEMACINGLRAWIEVADCGKPELSDEMCGYDPKWWANKIAEALEGSGV